MSAALIEQFDLLATSTGGIAKLRELILSLAVRGQLVPQDPSDEPASELLKKIRAEKDRLIAEGKIKRDKPLAEIGDDENPYELPAGWEWVRLGEVIEVIRGITFPASEKTKEPASGRIACLRTANVQERIEWDDLLFVDRSFMGREEQVIAQQDIVMSMANSRELVGKVAIIENIPVPEATFGGFLSVLRPILVLPKFAMVMLRTGDARSSLIDSSSQTTNIANISLAKLRPLLFPLPPLAEQSRIVAKVEELMALCDRLEAEQGHAARVQGHWVEAALDQLAESADADEFRRHWQHLAEHWNHLFTTPASIERLNATLLQLAVRGKLVPQDRESESAGDLITRITSGAKTAVDQPNIPFSVPENWQWTRLGCLVSAERGISYGIIKLGDEPSEGGIPTLRCSDVKPRHIDLRGVRTVSGDIEKDYARTRLLGGEVLLNIRGTLGGVAVVPPQLRGYNVAREVAVIPLHPDMLPEYVMNVMASAFFWQQISDNLRGLAYQGINLKSLREFCVPIPPREEQSRIVAQVEKLLALTAELKARLSAAQTKQAHLAETLIAEVV